MGFFELDCFEAAVGDLKLPANSGRSRVSNPVSYPSCYLSTTGGHPPMFAGQQNCRVGPYAEIRYRAILNPASVTRMREIVEGSGIRNGAYSKSWNDRPVPEPIRVRVPEARSTE